MRVRPTVRLGRPRERRGRAKRKPAKTSDRETKDPGPHESWPRVFFLQVGNQKQTANAFLCVQLSSAEEYLFALCQHIYLPRRSTKAIRLSGALFLPQKSHLELAQLFPSPVVARRLALRF